jgi:hypothetical protein
MFFEAYAMHATADHPARDVESPNTLLTTGDVARETGWSITKVRNLCESGRLPAINTGTGKRNVWEVRRSDLNAFLTPSARGSAEIPKPYQPPRQARRKRIDQSVPKIF